MTEPEGYQSASDGANAYEDNDIFTSDFTSTADGDSEYERDFTDTSFDGYDTDPPEVSAQTPTSLHWMRMSALRIHDNPALKHCLEHVGTRFRCVFILDPWFVCNESKIGVNRWRFLLECLHDVDKRLRTYNSRLYVAQGQLVAVLEELFHKWNVRQLTFQHDREPHSNAVEDIVGRLGESTGVKVYKFSSHTLYDPAVVLAANGNRAIMTPKAFRELLPKLGPALPPVNSPDVSVTKLLVCEDDSDIAEYRIPTMEDLGFPCCSLYTSVWVGGETEALHRLPLYCQLRCQNTSNTVDMLFDKSSLSPYVRFGCLSVRYFLWKVKWLSKGNSHMERVVRQLARKLLDREFYFVIAGQVPNYDMTENNPIPVSVSRDVVPNYDITENNPICLQWPWERDPVMFALWREGRTGYPWIDAALRQLHREGWIHNYLRESVAVFLTRGDLWLSWVAGKDVFEELLLDYESAVCCGLWMKSSCSAFLQGPIQHYCPVTFGKKIDPEGQYIRTFCPELRRMPSEYIYSPWLAPLSVQQDSQCMIGTDYPHPVVDHAIAGALCCEKLRSIMAQLQKSVSPIFPPP